VGLPIMPVAPAADALAEAFAAAQATLMVPSEYLQVCTCLCSQSAHCQHAAKCSSMHERVLTCRLRSAAASTAVSTWARSQL
jgi:hypothetical protein